MARRSAPWSAALTQRLVVGATLGLAVGSLGSAAGCQPKTADAYNEELAERLCEVSRNCPEIDLRADYGSVTFPTDGTCEAAVLMQYESCEGPCEYKRAPGRKCLRRLEKMAQTCQARSLAPCRRAYKCDTAEDESRCNLANCAARVGVPHHEGLPWLALLVVGLAARRRRRARV